MVLDYSKWDKIELSDDSDIEVHPNVDKRSFINAKRRQIQENRAQRKQQMEFYRTEIAMNQHLLKKLDRLVSNVAENVSDPLDNVLLKAVMMSNAEDDKDAPTPPKNTTSYGMMIAQLVDTVKKELRDEEKELGNKVKKERMVERLKQHHSQLSEQTISTGEKLVALEGEERAKITSDDLHEGFSSGHINKEKPKPTSDSTKKKTVTQKVQAVEQLNNPGARVTLGDQSLLSGAEADVEEEAGDDDDDEHIEPTELGREFAKIKKGDYRKCMQFISENPAVVEEKETDGLLIDAFNSQIDGKEGYARQCVHQALLLQYCRSLGRDGVSLFFKRITTPNHQAQKVFHDDVSQTYNRIRERVKEIVTERERGKGVEQIQLHAVEPGTQINITIPPRDSDDPDVQRSRAIFETFPPGLRRALESSSLDEVNKVLGKMSVEEAEEIVGQLSEGCMLSVESQILDATTEDGQKILQEFEENEKRRKDAVRGVDDQNEKRLVEEVN